jgi:hypothetical protein
LLGRDGRLRSRGSLGQSKGQGQLGEHGRPLAIGNVISTFPDLSRGRVAIRTISLTYAVGEFCDSWCLDTLGLIFYTSNVVKLIKGEA